jgi:hypothetical protein
MKLKTFLFGGNDKVIEKQKPEVVATATTATSPSVASLQTRLADAESDYENKLIVLALRQFAQNEFRNAIKALQEHKPTEGQECSERGQAASKIADQIGNHTSRLTNL